MTGTRPAPFAPPRPAAAGRLFAHRGLWAPAGPPENSCAAIRDAARAGYGVEFDVRLTRDGQAVVFHDAELDRMTGESGTLAARTADQIAALRLRGSSEPPPRLADALAAASGASLTLVELKTEAATRELLVRRALEAIAASGRPAALIGFDAAACALARDLVRELAPGTVRGLNLESADGAAAAVATAAPDLLLPEAGLLEDPRFAALRGEAPVVVWTVRAPAAARTLLAAGAGVIFEGFRP